jgi:hypothetical protein
MRLKLRSLSTRIALAPLAPSEGSAREALSSLYTVFGTTREVLREAGPEAGGKPDSVGAVAIRVLNEGVRPFVARWHTELRRFERANDDESQWSARPEFDRELERVRGELVAYVAVLAEIAGVGR